MRTTYIAKESDIERKWYVIDAEGHTLGRLSSQIAKILTGKNKPIYTPHVDTGDHVIIINAEKIQVTGKKASQKKYIRHTGYSGGLRERTFNEVMQKRPEDILYHAIKGMMPKNNLGRLMFKKLRVYAGPDHKHEAQQPEVLDMNNWL